LSPDIAPNVTARDLFMLQIFAFFSQLSWELRNLAFAEQECKTEYLELRRQCQKFAVDLLDQTRSSQELAIILNHDPGTTTPYMDGDHMKLKRLEMAIDFKQKKVCSRAPFAFMPSKAIFALFTHRQHSRSSLSPIQTFNNCWQACGTKVSKRNPKIFRR
jgi:hypothetical protein